MRLRATVLSTGSAFRPTYKNSPLKYRAGRNGNIFNGPYSGGIIKIYKKDITLVRKIINLKYKLNYILHYILIDAICNKDYIM